MAAKSSSHVCFAKIGEPKHQESHICFGKRVSLTLEPLEAAGCVAALEDAITELKIIARSIPFDRNEPEEDQYIGLEERFSKTIFEPDNFRNKEFFGFRPVDARAMVKLQRDRLFAEKILQKTLEDLRECDHYAALQGAMALEAAVEADENAVEEKLRAAKEKETTLKGLVADEGELMMKQNVFWGQKEEELLSAYHDTRLMSGLTLQFARQWERTRRDQLQQISRHREEAIRNEIDEIVEDSVVQEERAHMEIRNFLLEEHTNLKNDLDHWTDLYDKQMATREAEIAQLKLNKEANVEAISNAQLELEKRKQTMDAAIEMRAKFDRKKYANKQIQTIQAWWRGIYYRKNLSEKAATLLKKMRKKNKLGKRGKKKT